MPTPRVAAIHDMSGFGRCSLTVAIPVLSAMGVQCCPLPTAYLSTHTGGFTGYTFLDMTDELPKTAAVSVDDYVNLWKPFVEQGCEVVHINISSHFSACYQNACIVAGELGHVYPVDSRNLSTGIAQLALLAADVRKIRCKSTVSSSLSLSRIYSEAHFSKLPRYFLPTPILPSLTSMHGRSFRRFAPSSVTAEQRPPIFM